MSLLTLENITKEYGTRMVLNDISLRIERGERVALVGANGAGKTTLIRIALGLDQQDTGNVIMAKNIKIGYLSQQLEIAGGNAVEETARAFEKLLAIERRLRAAEQRMAEAPSDGPELEKLLNDYGRLATEYELAGGYSLEARIKSTLTGLGLREEALNLPADRLSGGEKMRVALARVLLSEAELLILDEPTNHLDIPATEWLEGFLRNFPGGVLVVSHDRYFLDQVATRVVELQDGTILERKGNYSSFLEQKERRREFILDERNRLLREVKRNEQIALTYKSQRKISAYHSRMKVAERFKAELERNRNLEHVAHASGPKIVLGKARHISTEVASAKNFSKSFGDVKLFDKAEFLIKGGEHVGIIGPNGCGKTTLLRVLMGEDEDYQGFARLGYWVRYGYLGQQITFEDEGRSVMEELMAGHPELSDVAARDWLAKFLFYGDDIEKRIAVLCGGERVRLYLACMLLDNPDCLILDEPTNHLDLPAREALEKALTGYTGTIIAISHDRYFLNRCVKRILAVEDYKLVSYRGGYSEYRASCGGSVDSGEAGGGGIGGGGDRPTNSATKATNSSKPANSATATKPKKPAVRAAAASSLSQKELIHLENEIFRLEEKLRATEALFGESAPVEVYRDYEEIRVELEQLYAKWAQQAE